MCVCVRAQGAGTLVRSSGEVSRGDWRAHRLHGPACRVEAADGSSYEGGFADGARDGQGVARGAGGEVYEGGWAGGRRHGGGVYAAGPGGGLSFDGQWREGAPCGTAARAAVEVDPWTPPVIEEPKGGKKGGAKAAAAPAAAAKAAADAKGKGGKGAAAAAPVVVEDAGPPPIVLLAGTALPGMSVKCVSMEVPDEDRPPAPAAPEPAAPAPVVEEKPAAKGGAAAAAAAAAEAAPLPPPPLLAPGEAVCVREQGRVFALRLYRVPPPEAEGGPPGAPVLQHVFVAESATGGGGAGGGLGETGHVTLSRRDEVAASSVDGVARLPGPTVPEDAPAGAYALRVVDVTPGAFPFGGRVPQVVLPVLLHARPPPE